MLDMKPLFYMLLAGAAGFFFGFKSGCLWNSPLMDNEEMRRLIRETVKEELRNVRVLAGVPASVIRDTVKEELRHACR